MPQFKSDNLFFQSIRAFLFNYSWELVYSFVSVIVKNDGFFQIVDEFNCMQIPQTSVPYLLL